MAGTQKGKGGSLDTRKNPFATGPKLVAARPEFASHSRCGFAIDSVIRAGCAIIIGSTRDGGAIVLTILDGEDRHRTYCSTDAELEDALHSVEMLYEI